jgi:hypothetical protein
MLDECDVSENDASPHIGNAHVALMVQPKCLDKKKWDNIDNNGACLKTAPPWRQEGPKAKYLENNSTEVVIAAPPAASKADDKAFFPNTTLTDLVNDSLPATYTFTGARDGPAENTDILEGKKEILMKTSTNRFENNNGKVNAAASNVNIEGTNESNTSLTNELWKQSSNIDSKRDKILQPKQKSAAKYFEVTIVISKPSLPLAADDMSNTENMASTLVTSPPFTTCVNLP